MLKKMVIFVILSAPLFSCGHRLSQVTLADRALLENMECVAIAPLQNLSTTATATATMEALLQNDLVASGKFRVMESQETRQLLAEKGDNDISGMVAAVATTLKIQGLLTGSLREFSYREFNLKGEVEPVVAMELKLYHVPSATLVWSANIVRTSTAVTSRNRDPLSRLAMLTSNAAAVQLTQLIPPRPQFDVTLPCGAIVNTSAP